MDGSFEVEVKSLTGEIVAFSSEVGSSIAEAVERYGEETVFTNFVIGAKTAARNKVYSATHPMPPKKYEAKIAAGEEVDVPDQAAIDAMMADWKPTPVGTREPGASSEEKLLQKVLAMSEEKRLDFLRKLQSQQ